MFFSVAKKTPPFLSFLFGWYMTGVGPSFSFGWYMTRGYMTRVGPSFSFGWYMTGAVFLIWLVHDQAVHDQAVHDQAKKLR
jgi:hypothetical protein